MDCKKKRGNTVTGGKCHDDYNYTTSWMNENNPMWRPHGNVRKGIGSGYSYPKNSRIVQVSE